MQEKNHLFHLACLLIVLTGGGGCRKPPNEAGKGGTAVESMPPVAVKVVPATLRQQAATEEIVGTVRSKTRAVIESKVSGRIDQLAVEPGQAVKAGELLAKIDIREYQARADQAKAMLQQATKDLERYEALRATNAVAKSEIDAVEARHAVAQAALREAEATLANTLVTAPFSGVVTRKLAEMGDLAGPGRPIAELEDPQNLRFETQLPEALRDHIKLGASMNVSISNQPNAVSGIVSEISPVADPASRTYLVKLDLPGSQTLRSGQFGRVAIPLNEVPILVIPAAALRKQGQMELVMIHQNGKAHLRLVKSGSSTAEEVQILSGILENDEIIIPESSMNIRDGQPVVISKP
jgi:RND family efflux transporter MFP subunit